MPSRSTDEARYLGDLAQALVAEADQLRQLVRDQSADALTAWFRTRFGVDLAQPDVHSLIAFAVVLAAMVHPTTPAKDLLAWVQWDEHLRPLPAADEPARQVVAL